jgi:hypothetical protein
MLLPGRAIVAPLELERGPIPEEELKEIKKPRTKAAPVRISGYVTVPDGRKLNGVKIQLIEYLERGFRFAKSVKTNSAGFYSIGLGGTWLEDEKRVKVDPKYADFRFGEHFTPRNYRFRITSANITNLNFTYNGPLPDLTPDVNPTGFRDRGGICLFYFRVCNHFAGASGPFKVRVRVKDKGPDLNASLESYKTEPVPSIATGSCETVEVELGPGTAADQIEGPMCCVSGSGRYIVKSVRVDIEDTVVECNENNNHFGFP